MPLSCEAMKTSHAQKRSKRQAYRFPGDNLSVEYKTAYDDGKALLSNISTTGCAIKQTSVPLMPQQKVLLVIEAEELEESLEATGMVVRVESGITAVQFTLIEKEEAKNIQVFFSKKMREMKRKVLPNDESK